MKTLNYTAEEIDNDLENIISINQTVSTDDDYDFTFDYDPSELYYEVDRSNRFGN